MRAAQTLDLVRLDDALRLAPELSPDLFRKITRGCTQLSLLLQSGKAAGIDRLIDVGAWTDAAFGLIEIELPAWTVRRVVRESGEWLRSLSRHSHLPIALDEPAEGSHHVLPLAILRAFVEAQRTSGLAPDIRSAVPQVRALPKQWICCDNFA
jgi:hypothetical protein